MGTLLLAAPLDAGLREDAAGLIAAERAFAADAARIGITPAFRAHVAPDGVLIRPDPAPALAVLARDVDVPGQRLEWQPAIAAIARSGDLGFTTGPYRFTTGETVLGGRFLTIWERGEDGRWRWYIDHGLPPVKAVALDAFPAKVTVLRSGVADAPRSGNAAADADTALNAEIVARGTATIPGRLARDGFLLRLKRGMVAKADAVREPGENMRVQAARTLGIRVSRAGDLAASYGSLPRSDAEAVHYYVRIWRRDGPAWRLVVDQVN